MEKSKHNYRGIFNIPVDELSNFINPINMSIFINKRDILSLFNNKEELNNYIVLFYNNIFKYLPSLYDEAKNYFISNYSGITYTPHTSGYDFRFNPIDFINSLFKYMHLDYEIPFINLDNGYGINYLKDYVRAYIDDFYRDDSQIDSRNYDLKVDLISELKDNLDNIVNMYYKDLDNIIYDNVIPKDMLLYLADYSLLKYEETNDEKYVILPYEYYHYVSHMLNSAYPHVISVNGIKQWFTDFRTKYKLLVGEDKIIDDSNYLLNDHEVLLAWDILKPGMLERQIRDTHDFLRSTPNVDYDKYLQLFEVKMNYYMNSPYINYIQGKYGLLGYIGFSYKNEYLIFDKFHNSETIDPSKKTILTHGEAIYALPSDRFSVLKGSKQDIIKAKETDDRIKKINHTPAPEYTFRNKLDDVINGPNLSYTTFDKVIDNEKKRMLIKK
ncbi:MAG: hypothetical protein IJ572_04185 [Bacilli bacterium]|nr:hypothetical protein [Bacilli bacterium]